MHLRRFVWLLHGINTNRFYEKKTFKLTSTTMKHLALVVVILALTLPAIKSGCYERWSRCSGWGSFLTGRRWLDCDTCCKCKGQASGECKLARADDCFLTREALYCDCEGTLEGPKPSACYGEANQIDPCE